MKIVSRCIMKFTIFCIINFISIALTTKPSLTAREGLEVLKNKPAVRHLEEYIDNEREQRGIEEKDAALKYYKELLRNLQNRKSGTNARTDNLSVEDASAVNSYISKFLESQIQGENELHLDPSSIPIVLDLLSVHQQQFTNVNSNHISAPSIQPLATTDPNDYAQVPYIPAIHGIHSSSLPGNEGSSLSDISFSQDSLSNATVDTDTRVVTTPALTATATSLAASLTSCRANMLCGLALAAGITAATVGAVAFPVLVAGPLLGNRKKRSPENFEVHQDNIIDIINNYNANHNPLITGYPISDLSESYYQQKDSDGSILQSNNSQESATESGNNSELSKKKLPIFDLNIKPENETIKILTYDSKLGINNDAEKETIDDESPTQIAADEIPDSIDNFYNSRTNDEFEKAKRGFKISTNFTLEHRIPNVNKNNPITEELTNRLRSNLYEFFSQFDQLSERLNISTQYEKKINNSNINNEKHSIFGILDYYLRNDSTRLATSLNDFNIENSSTNLKDSYKGPETPTKTPEDPFKTISSTNLFQNLILNNHRHELKETATAQPPTTLPPKNSVANKNEDVEKDLLKLLSDYIKIKQSQSSQDNAGPPPINPLAQPALNVQYAEKPPLINSVVIPSFSTFQSIQPESALLNTATQNIIPINTINGILQNPPADNHNLNLILTKLPSLINGPNKQQFQTNPIYNQKQHSQFAPTVFQNSQPSSGPYQGTHSVVQLRPPTTSLGNNSYQPPTGKPQGLAPEIRKFYGLLCKAILEPDVPLNKVTAYIAEKCLVMRFTGILKA